ncbi:hypothetical protein HZF05_17515 [Sphingomonas sp. CGMCC 1.13654]|uniref:Uncharacterized protein n=1 Tax=Sphingomonas chungangi TaxID=2683589 RepID=A0A838LAL8_9SPHN|nr:hypothetical protein [Sphingomonas chungangi]MBA2935882.1 hypothetical protein [Sphingomonas chungangi]MVW54573.1 hypothetical protein [Sphingomonas chungangi]
MLARDEAPVIGRMGVIAAAGAAGLVLAGWMRLASGPPAGWPVLTALGLASGAMIVTLCRTAMPSQLRGLLVAALIGTLFFGVARADPFGGHAAGDQVAQAADQAAQDRAAIDSYATGVAATPAPGGGGAELALAAGRNGGGDWARDINATWRDRIGGRRARDVRIDGWVDEEGGPDGLTRVAVDWGVTHHFASRHCGRTSSAGRDRATMIQAIAEPMVQAVERTLREGKASCP